MTQIALLPIAPILLMPFIILFFVIVFPIWIVAIAVLGLLLLITRGLDAVFRLPSRPISSPISNAFHWTLSWGGLAQRRDRPPVDQAPVDVTVQEIPPQLPVEPRMSPPP